MEAIAPLAELLAMAGNPIRLRILHSLALREELCVCDLAALAGMSSAAVSSHLQKLKSAGMVSRRRDGQMIRYSLQKRAEVEVLLGLLVHQEAAS